MGSEITILEVGKRNIITIIPLKVGKGVTMPFEKCKYRLKPFLIIEPIEFALWPGYYLVDFPANHGSIQYNCSGAKPKPVN